VKLNRQLKFQRDSGKVTLGGVMQLSRGAARSSGIRTMELLLPLLLLACSGLHPLSPLSVALAQGEIGQCVSANVSAMPYCGGVVSYPVLERGWDGSEYFARDAMAQADAKSFGRIYLDEVSCPFMARRNFQCQRYFPLCVNVTSTLPDGSVVVSGSERRVCTSTCMRALKANDGQCRRVGRLDDAFFNIECGKSEFFFPGAPPQCVDVPDDKEGLTEGEKWRIGLGVGIAVVIIIALGFMYRRYKRDRWTEAELRAHDDAKAKKLREKKAKEAEKEAKRQAALQKKADEKAGAALAAGAVAPSNSVSPPAPAPASNGGGGGGREGEIDLGDVELGQIEGRSQAAAGAGASAAAASAASPKKKKKKDGKESHKKKSHKDKEKEKEKEKARAGRRATSTERAAQEHRSSLQTPASRARTVALNAGFADAASAAPPREVQSARLEGQQSSVRLHVPSEGAAAMEGMHASASAPPVTSQWEQWRAAQPTRVALPDEEV